jgi:hypothetical protein
MDPCSPTFSCVKLFGSIGINLFITVEAFSLMPHKYTMLSFKKFIQLSEIAVDSWLEPQLQPTSALIAVYNGPIEGIHRGGEEPIGSKRKYIDPAMAPVRKNKFKNKKTKR